MRIKITADSTCDLTRELLEEYNIGIIPLYIIKAGKTYKDGINILPADIFRYVNTAGEMCSTAAVNVSDYTAVFENYSSKYDAVIHINIGSGFSFSYQNACIAAKGYNNVYVVDSQNLSTGQGHLVIEAAKLSKTGASAERICEKLNNIAKRIETSFILDRLDYLYKGGRCSLIAALGANILQLKISIEVVGGKMQVAKKYRGSFEKCVEAYAKDRLWDRDDIDYERVFITHCNVSPKAIKAARSIINQHASFKEIIETRAGCTISCHCGENTLGILFVRR